MEYINPIKMKKVISFIFLLLLICVMTFILRNKLISDNNRVFNLQDIVSVNSEKRKIAKANSSHQEVDAMYRNWIILMTVNTGYFDFYQNWFWYFQRHQLPVPVIVVAEDETGYKKLSELHINSKVSVTIERSESNITEGTAADFNSKQFNKLVGERPAHILRHLKLGNNVLYSDTDSVWLRNPFPYLVGEFDIWTQMDGSGADRMHCTGFLAIKYNNRTLQLMEAWKKLMVKLAYTNDQIGFKKLNKSTVRINDLKSELFPAGNQYFRELNDAKYANTVVVHNNFIIGHDRKKERFKNFSLWLLP